MRTTDLTGLRRKVEIVIRSVTDLWKAPRGFDAWVDQQIDFLNLYDEIAEVLDDLAEHVENKLDEAKIERKRCANPGCRRWIRIAETGRKRAVCDDACYAAVRRARRAAA